MPPSPPLPDDAQPSLPPLRLSNPGAGPYKGWHAAALAGLLGSVLRGGVGYWVLPGTQGPAAPRPGAVLELYGTEGDPACQRAREAFSRLDLAYVHRPCPAGGGLWRPAAERLVQGVRGPGARLELPVLVDGGQTVVGARAVVDHLFARYAPPGHAVPPLSLRSDVVAGIGCRLTRAMRPGRGLTAAPATRATAVAEPAVVIFGYECSPFVRLVREVADELQVTVRMECSAHGSARRPVLQAKWGRPCQFPYLEDTAAGVALFESGAIIEHLKATYG